MRLATIAVGLLLLCLGAHAQAQQLRAQCPECLPAERAWASAKAAYDERFAENVRLHQAEEKLEMDLWRADRALDFAKGEIARLHETLGRLDQERNFLGMRIHGDAIDHWEKVLKEKQAELPALQAARDRIAGELDALKARRAELLKLLRELAAREDATRTALIECNRTKCGVAPPPPPPPGGVFGVRGDSPQMTQEILDILLRATQSPSPGASAPPPPPSKPLEFGPLTFGMPGQKPIKPLTAECPECVPAQRAWEAAQATLSAHTAENMKLHAAEQKLETDLWRADLELKYAQDRIRDLYGTIGRLGQQTFLGMRLFSDAIEHWEGVLKQKQQELPGKQQARDRIAGELAALKAKREALIALMRDLSEQVDALRAALIACNEKYCKLPVLVETVIGIFGNNPFNPDNPIGTGGSGSPPPTPGGIGSLQLSAATYSGGEGGAVLVMVTRTGGSRGQVSVQYSSAGGSATPGADFTPPNGVLSWADGDTTPKSFSIALTDDTAVEPTESFTVTLSSPGGGAALGSPASATVSIADNDSTPPPTQTGSLQLNQSSYATAEGQGSVTITVARSGGSAGAATVQYFTGPSSATAGQDYTAASGALAWADGDAGAKTFTVSIIDDTQVEGPETFFVTLNNVTGATLGAPATATVTIADNDTSTPVGPCGPQGHAWQPNTGAPYSCSGSCDPSPASQTLTVNGTTVTVSPFHAGGAATFNGCSATLNSDSSTLVYFGQANHRATITRTSNNNFSANITSSGGGTCFFSCNR